VRSGRRRGGDETPSSGRWIGRWDPRRKQLDAVELCEQSDGLYLQGDALFDLAEVLEAAGRRDEAAALREALERYERKRIVPLARRTRERLATLEQAPARRRPYSPSCAQPQRRSFVPPFGVISAGLPTCSCYLIVPSSQRGEPRISKGTCKSART
jgi:hypothetical protein